MTHHIENSVIAAFARQQHVWMELVRKGYLDPARAVRAIEALVDRSNGERFIVDYGMSLKEMIALGRYGWVNSNINAEHFPIIGAGIVESEWKLSLSDHSLAYKEIVRRNTALGWEPGKIEHLLAFGAAMPDEYPVVGLGSLMGVGEARLAPCLVGGPGLRGLDLKWCNLGFGDDHRFLFVRTPPQEDR